MAGSKTLYRTTHELVEAFLEQPLPKEIYQLSRFGKVDPPWTPPGSGATPEDYAAAWTVGYDGGPIKGAFRWLGQQGMDASAEALPKSMRKRGRAPKRPLVTDFEELPEAERVIKSILRHGGALHDIQELLMGFKDVWTELDRIRPDTWAVEDMIDLLGARNSRGRSIDSVPASMVFVWNSSDEPFHARQIAKAERLLIHGLKAVMPGTF